jgi:PAS domain S-box-containing protein
LAALIGASGYALSNMGITPSEILSKYSLKTGCLLQIIFYALAMVDRNTIIQKNLTVFLERKVKERSLEIDIVNSARNKTNEELKLANEQLTRYKNTLEAQVYQRTEELSETNASLQALINESPLAILDTNAQGVVLSVWNRAAENLFGWTREEVIKKPLPYIDDENRLEIIGLLNTISKGQSIPYIELKRKNRSGKILYLKASLTSIFNSKGEFERVIAIFDDITERKQMRDAIWANEIKFRAIFENAQFGIVIYQADQVITDINKSALEMSGYTYSEAVGKYITDFIPEKYHIDFKVWLHMLLNGEKIPSQEYEIRRNDGSLIWVEGESNQLKIGEKSFLITVFNDISFRKTHEQKLFETVIETEERERNHFAGDLHDELGPQLASLRLYASSLKRRISDPEQISIVDTIMEIIKNSISNIREISNNLSPHILDTYGLLAAIESELEMKKAFLNFNIHQNINKLRFEKNKEIIVYRATKELINNTLKYAQATKVEIVLKFDKNSLFLLYQDDGKGFDYETLLPGSGKRLGLLNIQSRVKSVQGSCNINSKPGSGFRLDMSLPATKIE